METRIERRLTAVLAADVVGYTRLMADDDMATVQTLAGHRDVLRQHIEKEGGRVVDAVGDNMLAEFPRAHEAVLAAIEMQRALQLRNRPLSESRQMLYRIGIHLGRVLVEHGNLYGEAVNVAARMESLALPGGICVSENVQVEIEGKIDLMLEDLGHKRLKNFPEPVRAFRIASL